MGKIIDARYRERGYRICWLLFGTEDSPEKADMAKLEKDIVIIHPEDSILSCGVSLRRHKQEKIYPDPEFIFAQLPPRIDTLIIGGFHFADCVGRVAAVAYRKRYGYVWVDEDVTDYFFTYTVLGGEIPLIREEYPALDELVGFGDWREKAVREREGKPWLRQFAKKCVL